MTRVSHRVPAVQWTASAMAASPGEGERPTACRLAALRGSALTTPAPVANRTTTGGPIINLKMGSPDLPPPPYVIEALREAALQPDAYRYPQRDCVAFREAVATWYKNRFGISLNPGSEVLGLLGSQEGLAHIAMAVTDPGDLIMVPDPGYPVFHAGPTLCGNRLYRYRLTADNGFAFVPASIPESIWREAKLLFLNYPSNPLASTVPPGLFSEVVDYAARYNVVVVHDSAYSELTYDGYEAPSFLATSGATEVGIEVGSLSKTFNMAGCRVGYAAGNRQILSALAEVKAHLDPGIFLPIQMAAAAALTGPMDFVKEVANIYRERRDLLVSGLRKLGWDVPLPRATMFAWAPVPEGWTAVSFADELASRAGVLVAPGVAFGLGGEGYVRIALVQPKDQLEEVLRRVAKCGFPFSG